jgi:hypothetical protein
MLKTRKIYQLRGKDIKLLFLLKLFSGHEEIKSLFEAIKIFLNVNYLQNHWQEISFFIALLGNQGISEYAIRFKMNLKKKLQKNLTLEIVSMIAKGRRNFSEVYENPLLTTQEKILLEKKLIELVNCIYNLRKELFQNFTEEGSLQIRELENWFIEKYFDLENFFLHQRMHYLSKMILKEQLNLSEAFLRFFNFESKEVILPVKEDGKLTKFRINKKKMLEDFLQDKGESLLALGIPPCFLLTLEERFSLELKLLRFNKELHEH